MKKHIRVIENLHVLLWLLKDYSWCVSWHYLGLGMVAPTLLVAMYVTWINRRDFAELCHNVAVCLWICANITWMIGEFFFDDGTRPIARVFFVCGLGTLAVYYVRAAAMWRPRRS